MKKILFIVQYPKSISPSQRFRMELYENVLKQSNIKYDVQWFIDASSRKIIYKKGYLIQKTWGVVKGFCRRLFGLFKIPKYDFIAVYREAAPIGPPVFEWIYAKVFRKKIIYDFDDAIWLPAISESNNLVKSVTFPGKVAAICKWSYKVSVGNMYLYNYAAKHNNNVVLNPTCVDTENHHNIIKQQNTGKVTIGWTGSFSTLLHLKIIVEVLQQLEKKYDFDFIVIADKDPQLSLKGFKFLKWNKETEIHDLLQCNIGVMPLHDNEFEKGKCGFKIIQYLALGIPAAASPVGVNKDIIEENKNGFLCATPEQWYLALETLLLSTTLREQMGSAGRKKIEKSYSVHSNASNFLSLFQ